MLTTIPAQPQPLDSVIEIWFADLDQTLPLDPGAILSPAELHRAARFVQPHDALHYRNAHMFLRIGLGFHLGATPLSIQLEVTGRGKPYLSPEIGLYFNLSHCNHFAAVAFTRVGEVGIDIEPESRVVDAAEIAEAYFTPAEARFVHESGSPMEQHRRFLRIWTRKEAVLKATGSGITDSLRHTDVLGATASLPDSQNHKNLWRIHDLTPPFAAISAVAALETPWTIRCIHIKPDNLAVITQHLPRPSA